MAKKKITKKARISVVKKRWYEIQSPSVFNSMIIGETLAVVPESIVGRSVRINLGTLMKSGRKQNVDVTLRINEVKAGKCHTEFYSLEIVPSYVKRLVKRAKSRIDDSFVVEMKDGVKIRLKPLLLVRSKVQRAVLTDLRNKAKEILTEKAKELTLNEFINKTISAEILKGIKAELKHIHLVNTVEMRAMVRQKK
jgi:small subunit ribosomal protein S3Ae